METEQKTSNKTPPKIGGKKALKKEKASLPRVEATFAVVRIRGVRGVRWRTRAVLHRLRLTRKNHCILVKNTESAKGMLELAKDYLTWGEASPETIAVLEKKGKQPFALKPPLGGMEPIKQGFPRGALGYRGEKMNELVKKML